MGHKALAASIRSATRDVVSLGQPSCGRLEICPFSGRVQLRYSFVNFFLDQELNLKVGDWAGASIDGAKSHSSYRLRYRLFDTDGKDVPRATGITASTEIFALGTAIYYMVTCEEPWPELREPDDREEIKRRIRTKKFPDTRSFPILGNVIRRCWYVDFTSMTEVCDAIEEERKRANN